MASRAFNKYSKERPNLGLDSVFFSMLLTSFWYSNIWESEINCSVFPQFRRFPRITHWGNYSDILVIVFGSIRIHHNPIPETPFKAQGQHFATKRQRKVHCYYVEMYISDSCCLYSIVPHQIIIPHLRAVMFGPSLRNKNV